MKTLSIRQPYASLVCKGIKTVENRSWDTKYRGKLFIHASGKALVWPELKFMTRAFIKEYHKYYGYNPLPKDTPKTFIKYTDFLKELLQYYHLKTDLQYNMPMDEIKKASKEYSPALPSQCIIGEVELVDIITNSKDAFAEPACYHWIFEKPVVYEKPILNVMGKLQLWECEQS
jgi:hypothetical protein